MTTVSPPLPAWASELIALYESDAANQFILFGDVHDRFVLPTAGQARLAGLMDFFLHALLPRFDVVFSFDVGNGIRIEKGGEQLAQWPAFKENPELPRAPRAAIEWLTRYFRYCANLARLGQARIQVACIVKAADLVAPALPGGLNFDLSALALLLRDWSTDAALTEHALVTFLVTENLHDLHPILTANPRAAKVKIPLPTTPEITRALELLAPRHAETLGAFAQDLSALAPQFTGASLNAIESLLKLKRHRRETLGGGDLVQLKKRLVEDECQGLIEFIDSRRTLDDLHGQPQVKAWLRQDLALWKQGRLQALPMGYLICGPVGAGKTYLVECLAGEAGTPVIKIKNFRDKWVGSTEGNLEKIFRLLAALQRCYVFIDEADQALGKRDSGGNDSGLSGRIYSMVAAEMSRPENRGRIIWILASSRPDLIEVDLKRPGRVDVRIPIFPTVSPEESWELLRALCRRQGLDFPADAPARLEFTPPPLLTSGAAESLALKIYRAVQADALPPEQALVEAARTYRSPIAAEIMAEQIRLTIAEASDAAFVPEYFRHHWAERS